MKRIKIDFPSITGIGPYAWDHDNQPLKINPLHIEKNHLKERKEGGTKTATHKDEKTLHKGG